MHRLGMLVGLLTLVLLAACGRSGQSQGSGPVTVKVRHNVASPTAGIQEAIGALPAGGGIVLIPAGTYELDRSVVLRSNVVLQGENGHTILARRTPCRTVPLAAAGVAGATQVEVKDPSAFAIGREVCVVGDKLSGWYATHAIVTGIDGRILKLDRPLVKDYPLDKNAVALNYFPAIHGREIEGVRVTDLIVDGREGDRAKLYYDFPLSAIHFDGVRDGQVARLQVKRWPADGISVQRGGNVTVTDCLSEYNLGHGYHPGTGVNGSTWTNNVGRFNGMDGFFFCSAVHHAQVSGNRFHNNAGHGIGNLGLGSKNELEFMDRYNIVSGNICADNGQAGIECLRGGNNIVVNNICENNSHEAAGRWPGIMVEGTHATMISGNRCFDTRPDPAGRTQRQGIVIKKKSQGNIISGNMLSGHTEGDIIGEALSGNTIKDNVSFPEHVPDEARLVASGKGK